MSTNSTGPNNGVILPIDPRAYIRTYVPVVVGAIVGWLLATYTWLNDWLTAAATILPAGTNWRDLLNAAAIATVTALYYWGARQLGKRWPKIEKWMLGSSATPNYTAR